jgi:CubicO group peptidase (beta-lactamase class C family)
MRSALTTTKQAAIMATLRQIDEWVGDGAVTGAAAAVWLRGEIVAVQFAGESQPGVPVDTSTLFPLASVTKPIVAATALALVEEGRFALDEPVVRFVPEFADQDPSVEDDEDSLAELRATVTVRQLLSHTSGLPEDLPRGWLRLSDKPDLTALIDAMARLPLQTAPGAELRYSNAGYGLLARVIERVTGEDTWAVAERNVLQPLRLADIVARPAPSLDQRIAHLADTSHPGTDTDSYNSAYWRGLAIPWGGLYGSVVDIVRFAGSFLGGGSPILSPPSIRLMTTDQAGGVPGGVGSMRVRWPVASWGLGWEVKGAKQRHWTGDLTSPRTFCHFGAAGTLVWADPDRDVALAVFGNRTTYHLWPFVPARWARLSNALIAAVT